MMKKLDELALITRCVLADDRQAFGQLVEAYQQPLRRFLLNLTLGNSALSDDLAQETIIKAYVGLRGFKGIASFSTWLYRIAYNVFYDNTRRQHFTEDITSKAVQNKPSPRHDSDLQMDIHEALKILKEEERTCIILQMMEGQSIDQIAAITGMAEGTVKSHLSRGKKQLATYLKENGYG